LSPTAEAETGAADTEKSNTTEEGAAFAALAVSAASEFKGEMEDTTPALSFTATAYSLRGRTASGRPASRGVIAADRSVLPIGTRVRLEAGQYSGEYVVADTGGSVRGRKIDIWVPNAGEAMRFGRRPVRLTVLTRTRQRTAARQGRR
jgi:3D (Asp-Asp-Asp) domain-containing protein